MHDSDGPGNFHASNAAYLKIPQPLRLARILVIINRLSVRVEIHNSPIRHPISCPEQKQLPFLRSGRKHGSRSRRKNVSRFQTLALAPTIVFHRIQATDNHEVARNQNIDIPRRGHPFATKTDSGTQYSARSLVMETFVKLSCRPHFFRAHRCARNPISVMIRAPTANHQGFSLRWRPSEGLACTSLR